MIFLLTESSFQLQKDNFSMRNAILSIVDSDTAWEDSTSAKTTRMRSLSSNVKHESKSGVTDPPRKLSLYTSIAFSYAFLRFMDVAAENISSQNPNLFR